MPNHKGKNFDVKLDSKNNASFVAKEKKLSKFVAANATNSSRYGESTDAFPNYRTPSKQNNRLSVVNSDSFKNESSLSNKDL